MGKDEYLRLLQEAREKGAKPGELTRILVEEKGYDIEGLKDLKRSNIESKVNDDISQKQASSKKASGWMKNAIGGALDSVTGLPKLVFKGVTRGIASIADNIGATETADKMREATDQIADTNIGQDKDSLVYKGTKLVGDIAQTARLGGVLGEATGVVLPTEGGVIKQAISGGIGGVRDAYIYDMVANSELPNKDEVKMSAIVGGSLPVIGKIISGLGSKLYQSAFRGVKKSLDEESVTRYGYRAGKLIEDESLGSYTISGLKKETGANLQNTWKLLVDKANDTKPVPITDLKSSLKSDLAKKLVEGLPESANKDAIISNIDEIVDFYVGDGASLQGKEAVSLIKNMNSQIPDSLFKKSANVLDPSRASTVIRQMKDGIQKFLEKQDEGITALYGDYSRNKLIEEVLENIEVKKALGREIIGAVAGGSLYGREDLKEGNIGAGISKAIIGALIGGAALRITGNPDKLITGGKLLKNAGNNIGQGTQKFLQPLVLENNNPDKK